MHRLLAFLAVVFVTIPSWAASPQKPIINGDPAYSDDPRYYATVLIQMESGSAPMGMCSGTLIAPDTVLTASHCVDGITGATVYFFEGSPYNYVDAIRASDWHTSPTWNRNALTGDIAIIKLSRNAPPEIDPILPLPPSMAVTDNDINSTVFTLVGFGKSDASNDNSAGTRRVAQTYLRAQCSNSGGCTVYAQPLGGYVRIQEGTLLFYQQDLNGNLSGTCQGDSGGPAFIERNGVYYVAGVTSYGDSYQCDGVGVDTKVDYYYDFIASYVDLNYEICTNGQDDDHDGLVDCDDPDCSTFDGCIPTACESAQTLSCNQTVSGNTANGVTKFTMQGSGCTSTAEKGPEVGYTITPPSGETVTITLHPDNSNSDLDLFLLSSACDQTQCEEKSMLDPGHDETITFTADGGSYYIIVETYENPGPYTLTVTCGGGGPVTGAENCSNGKDDDGDGKVDCLDPDCASTPACSTAEDCSNGVDDDHDGAVDCQDADCASTSACTSAVENCVNGVDDDGDGFADCQDADCAESAACAGKLPENCIDGVDNDNDGKTDCDDPDCMSSKACAGAVENCSDGVDNDGDGLPDCRDADCQSHQLCRLTVNYPEICYDNIDNDGDGKIDCYDPDCASYSKCAAYAVDEDNNPPSLLSCRTSGGGSVPLSLLIASMAAVALARRRRG